MNESPELVLDGGNPIPEQIESQIRWLVSSGALRPGEELPTVRAVAVGLGISPRAVEQAYNQLAQESVITWADSSAPRVYRACSEPEGANLKQLCGRFLRQATAYGYSRAAILHAIQTCLQRDLPSCARSLRGSSSATKLNACLKQELSS
jgi:DNA-binding transcriptional regulator YhcF (GntR family)